jgi:plasmid stabilization system protein ParE
MAKKLEFSKEALESLENIQAYISAEFGDLTAQKYEVGLETLLQSIDNFPAQFPLLDKDQDANLRKCVFQKHTILLYVYDDDTLFIEAIHDARSNWKVD